jgi:hypothetical protein
MLASRAYDSEPDLFTANFLGHALKFIRDFSDGSALVILNKKTYKVVKTTNGFCITTATGSKYYFELKSEIENLSYSESIDVQGALPSGTAGYETSTIMYFLTQITTAKGNAITFQYDTTSLSEGYPGYSDKFQALTDSTNNTMLVPPWGTDLYVSINSTGDALQPNGTFKTFSGNREHYVYLKSITYPGGRIDFQTSSRSDITNGKKLDQIQLKTLDSTVVKTWQLDYSYFDTLAISGNGYTYGSGSPLSPEARSSLRLKLLDVKELKGGVYSFTYDSIPLPKKNSFARDYWGFYNGKLSNTSLVPNPGLFGLAAYADSNSRASNLTYAKADILEQIQYPTGGKVIFDYELNDFNKDQIIGLPDSSSTVQHGCGLRIYSVYHTADLQNQALKTTYSYQGGKLMTPLQLFKQIDYNVLLAPYTNPTDYIYLRDFTLKQINANGVFSSNPLASINGVGYDTVIKKDVDRNGVGIGKTMTIFTNELDSYDPTIGSRVQFCDIPTVKSNVDPENGSVNTIRIYNDQDSLLKTVKNTYIVRSSAIYYGARIFPYRKLYAWMGQNGHDYFEMHIAPQNVVGYYPIFDCETLLRSDTTIEYANNISLTTTSLNSYDSMFNQLNYSSGTASGITDETIYSYPYNNTTDSVCLQMYLANHLSDIISVAKNKTDLNDASSFHTVSYFDQKYSFVNNRFWQSKTSVLEHKLPFNEIPTDIFYDQYDSSANLLQYTTKNLTNSFIWDYNSQYVTAEVKNTPVSLTAYSSFEAGGKGNWTFSGTPISDLSSPTGKKAYALTNGSISKSSLDSTKTYIVSYWSKNGQQTVNGTSSIAGRSLGSWTYYEHQVANPSSGTITVSGSGTIDELRLYPKGAFMTTYTYAPLIGITSQCDLNNRISYYEYDSVGRLALIRDQDKNILKQIYYNYAGQAENCHIATVYVNSAASQSFRRNNCSSGQMGTTVTYTIPQGKYTSAISQHIVDSLVQADFSASGQSYANINGSCVCDVTVCTGSDPSHKCINGVCESGTAICISSVFDSGLGQWVCTWYYFFTDCSSNYGFVTYSGKSCHVGGCH